jgi:hypothetical protein
MKVRSCVTAATLACAAGLAHAQFVVDGKITPGENWGNILWVQDTPTAFGDNIAGQGSAPGNPANVTTGAEIAVPLAALGNPNLANGLKLLVTLSGGGGSSFLSNQFLCADPLPSNSPNLADARQIDLSSPAFPGNQFLTIFPQVASSAPTLDGELDGGLAGYWAGRRVAVQQNFTGFGDNSLGQPGAANGSELDNLYAVVYDNATPLDSSDDILYLFIGGNFHGGNRVTVWFDAQPGGQNRLLAGNTGWGFGFLNNMGESSPGSGDGFKFDDGFEPEVLLAFNTDGGGTTYLDWITIPSSPPGEGGFVGCTSSGLNPGNPGMSQCGSAGTFPPGLVLRFNNSNTAGVPGSGGSQTTPDRDLAFGSEINGLYGVIDGDYLRLLVTGNLQSNFNKLVLFFDADPAEGQNTLRADNIDLSFNGLNRMGNGGNGTPGAGPGLTFDADFFADAVMFVTNGNNPVEMYTDVAVLRANGPLLNSGFIADYSANFGGPKTSFDPNNFPATYANYQDFSLLQLQTNAPPRLTADWALLQPPPFPGPDLVPPASFANQIEVSIDNNNVAGVTSSSVAGAAAVTTGIEIKILLSEIGCNNCDSIKVAGGILSDGFGFASNQWLGGLNGLDNLGEPSLINFTAIPGNQYVVVTRGSGGPSCEPDFNQDGNVDQDDIACLAQVVAGDPSCSDLDPDFNADGNVDQDDIDALAQVVAGSPCP